MLFWFIQMAWNSLGILISSNNWAMPKFSSIQLDMWVLLHVLYFCRAWWFLQQPLAKLLFLSLNSVILVTLECDHCRTKYLPHYQARVTTASYKHLLTDLLLELRTTLFFAPGPIYFFSWTNVTKVIPLDMVGHAKTSHLHQRVWWSRWCDAHCALWLLPGPVPVVSLVF